jgi:HK97 family phage major capsid protein
VGFTDNISRTDVQALIPEEVQREIVQGVPEQSAIMRVARRLPDMSRNQRRMPVLSSLITANFVNGDTGLKQTGDQLWANKFIDAEELAVIVPIPDSVLSDVDYDIWAEVRPRIVEAFGLAFDLAVLFGTNAPTSWPDDILTGATNAGNLNSLATFADIYDAIMSETGVLADVETDGFEVNGHIAALSMKGRLRGLRDANGQPIFLRSMTEAGRYELDGSPIFFPRNGGFNPSMAHMFSGDWTQLVWAIRQDITFKLLDQAVITDGAGNIVFNLPEQDMVALRAVIRLGWQVPNPINRVQPTEGDRYPFAALVA